MVAPNRASLERAITGALAEHGFRKTRDSWYRETAETVGVVQLQKSDWGGQFYLNLAVCIKAIGCKPFPKEHECHVRVRITSLADDSNVSAALNLDDPTLDPEARHAVIDSALRTLAVPLLLKFATARGVVEAYRSGTLRKAFVDKRVKQLLDDD
jgi:hypothetical protein